MAWNDTSASLSCIGGWPVKGFLPAAPRKFAMTDVSGLKTFDAPGATCPGAGGCVCGGGGAPCMPSALMGSAGAAFGPPPPPNCRSFCSSATSRRSYCCRSVSNSFFSRSSSSRTCCTSCAAGVADAGVCDGVTADVCARAELVTPRTRLAPRARRTTGRARFMATSSASKHHSRERERSCAGDARRCDLCAGTYTNALSGRAFGVRLSAWCSPEDRGRRARRDVRDDRNGVPGRRRDENCGRRLEPGLDRRHRGGSGSADGAQPVAERAVIGWKRGTQRLDLDAGFRRLNRQRYHFAGTVVVEREMPEAQQGQRQTDAENSQRQQRTKSQPERRGHLLS